MKRKTLLDTISNSKDIKKLNIEELVTLSEEIRKYLIDVVSQNGGHLASNLGVVELTIALHRVFDLPKDKIVFDVGHQCYTHKILSGRREELKTLRQKGGISGFTKASESEYDAFIGGHSSTSVSASLGIIAANKINGKDDNVIAVVGDGAMTGGMIFEGLNNASKSDNKLIVVINDNEMSISKNVGSLAKYLAKIRSSRRYFKTKENIGNAVEKIPYIGTGLKSSIKNTKNIIKNAIYHNTYFEDMGFDYYGPIDGHNFEMLLDVLEDAKKNDGPCVVHVLTKKGKGYSFAEEKPEVFHGVSKFDCETGNPDLTSEDSFSVVFGKALVKLGDKNDKICAITAAMSDGTGLDYFKRKFPKRFFDVGIAEGHAITFGAGMASQGCIPVVAIYSTFLQRAVDQVVHDLCIEPKHMIIGVDRAGISGSDGETHQGLLDVPFFLSVPGSFIYCPCNYSELESMLEECINKKDAPCFIRYPKGKQDNAVKGYTYTGNKFDLIEEDGSDTLVLTYGRLFANVIGAKEELKENNISFDILKINELSDCVEKIAEISKKYKRIIFYEEAYLSGSVAEKLGFILSQKKIVTDYIVKCVPKRFIEQMTVSEAFLEFGFDVNSIKDTIKEGYN